jgi:cobalt-zinc-cadmium resistance protein CzcA
MAEFFVDLKPPAEWPRGLTRERLIDDFSGQLSVLPGVESSFSQPIRDNVLESISQIDGQIVINVFGPSGDELRTQTENVLRAVSHMRGVGRAYIDRAGQVPQLQIEVDRAKCARYGLNVADIQDVIETPLAGKKPAKFGKATNDSASPSG